MNRPARGSTDRRGPQRRLNLTEVTMARKALLIGINRYRIPGADLRGCVNDVTNLSRVLVDLCGFAKGDIKVLIDENATQVAMQKGIRALVSGGRKGDVLLLHYSGHGANVPDADGDEADTIELAIERILAEVSSPNTFTPL